MCEAWQGIKFVMCLFILEHNILQTDMLWIYYINSGDKLCSLWWHKEEDNFQ
jgi:hypothetical protein